MNLYEIIEEYNHFIIIAAVSLSVLSLIAVLAYSIRTRRLMRRYKKLMRGMDNKNLEAMLLKHIDLVENAVSRIENLESNHKIIINNLESCLQNIYVKRYNPFDQVGGNLSFSIALLDKKGDGIVITGLFTRNSSSIYAKPVKNKASDYPLSQEEIEAIEKAMG